jgi:hypothetical protein
MYLLRILLLENLGIGWISNLLSGLYEDGFKIFIALNVRLIAGTSVIF